MPNAQHVTQMKGFVAEAPSTKERPQTVWDLQATADKAAAKAAKTEPAPADPTGQPDAAPAEQEK